MTIASGVPVAEPGTRSIAQPLAPAAKTARRSASVTVRVLPAKSGPFGFALMQSYPNPFETTTVIRYSLAGLTRVSLDVFSVAGERIARLVDGLQGPGAFQITWDGRDERGRALPLGIYIYRLEAGAFVQSRKLLVLR